MSGRRPVPRIGLTREEAAEALGVGLTTFKTQIQPHLKVWRSGKLRVFPVAELERWLDENAERVLDECPPAGVGSPGQQVGPRCANTRPRGARLATGAQRER